MTNNDAIYYLKLGYSYLSDVLEQIRSGGFSDNHQLSSEWIRNLKSALKNFDIADNLDPDAKLEDGMNITYCKVWTIGTIGSIKYHGFGERENAAKMLKEALEVNDGVASFHADLGLIYADQGEKQLAIDHLKRAIELDPDAMIYRKVLDKLEDKSESALKMGAFRGNRGCLLGLIALSILTLIFGFSDPTMLLAALFWSVTFGVIAFLYWKHKSKK